MKTALSILVCSLLGFGLAFLFVTGTTVPEVLATSRSINESGGDASLLDIRAVYDTDGTLATAERRKEILENGRYDTIPVDSDWFPAAR